MTHSVYHASACSWQQPIVKHLHLHHWDHISRAWKYVFVTKARWLIQYHASACSWQQPIVKHLHLYHWDHISREWKYVFVTKARWLIQYIMHLPAPDNSPYSNICTIEIINLENGYYTSAGIHSVDILARYSNNTTHNSICKLYDYVYGSVNLHFYVYSVICVCM
jgi:ribosomal protein S15P/S13E